uniref:Uncharacterized protein n=1 Tax=Oryza rufipogon TaxID=4529 RepID=A0A0E0NF46_ORYRU
MVDGVPSATGTGAAPSTAPGLGRRCTSGDGRGSSSFYRTGPRAMVVGEEGGEAVCPCRSPGMDKLVQFGRKAWFVVRVLSGYEERRIRAHRLQMQQQIARAQAKKEELRKQPEQIILSEVRQMVQQMQALNQQLEETETAIDEYFKPIDKNAKIITDMQLEKEEKQIKEMTKVMQDQIAMQREIASKRAQATAIESKDTQTSDKIAEGPPKEETMK